MVKDKRNTTHPCRGNEDCTNGLFPLQSIKRPREPLTKVPVFHTTTDEISKIFLKSTLGIKKVQSYVMIGTREKIFTKKATSRVPDGTWLVASILSISLENPSLYLIPWFKHSKILGTYGLTFQEVEWRGEVSKISVPE
jgi:hypothetical protein